MRKKLLIYALSAAVLFSGCSKIEYPEYTGSYTTTATTAPDTTSAPDTTTAQTTPKPLYSEHSSPEPVLNETDYKQVYQLEFNTDSYVYSSGLAGYNGDGFIQLGNNSYTTLTVNVPASQHYKLGVRVCTTGCTVSVILNGENVITGYDGYETLDGEMPGAFYAEAESVFTYIYLDGVYMSSGENKITLQGISGTAYLDEFSIEDGTSVPENCYDISGSPVNRNSNLKTIGILKYLSDIYGEKTLTGQYCSNGTDTEAYTIAVETGRFPAIRGGDLGCYTEYYTGADREDMTDLENAVKWSEAGGLVTYSWKWYAPTTETSWYADSTSFDITAAVTDEDVALMDISDVMELCASGNAGDECYRLVCDIDAVAEKLKYLRDNNVTVLFRPLPEAGNGWYWWGADSEAYKWLWRLVYDRMTNYHYLNNLIWVWNGESYSYYPGDDTVDILSDDIYNITGVSGNTRMMNTVCFSIKTKAAALSECAVVPSPDVLLRDNSRWLWFALWRGDFIINPDGTLNEQYTTKEELNYAYNHELFVTRDELPDFEEYALNG